MDRLALLYPPLFALVLAGFGCGSDGDAAGSAGISDTDTDTDTAGQDTATAGNACGGPCDDGEPCTEDSCGDDGSCAHEWILSNSCRPEIQLDYPDRGATIQADDPDPTVLVIADGG